MTTRLLAAFFLCLFALGVAAAQAYDPTLQQTYQAANAGEIARAQRKVDAVLKKRPDNARAHYVKAELSARQHDYSVAREELAIAEKLAPGLPFAKKESLQSLRKQIALAPVPGEAPDTRTMGAAPEAGPRPSETPREGPWGTIALGAGFAGIAAWMLRRRATARAQEDANTRN